MLRGSLLLLSMALSVLAAGAGAVFAAAPYELSSGQDIGGVKTTYVSIDMNSASIRPVQLSANGNLLSVAPVADMAAAAGAFAAINGTYFEAYNGTPVPWGTLIRDGKLLHSSNGGAVVGFTDDGRLLVDRLRFDFMVYVNGAERAIPWRINHPSDEADAITLFTPEYGAAVSVAPGAKAVLIDGGTVSRIVTEDFWTPNNGFALLYGPAVTYLLDERFKPGDAVYYDYEIGTAFTLPDDWASVKVAVGAGPSLIINGRVTADGAAEGFTEAKINTNRAARSFVGATENGRVVIGNMAAATLLEAASACQALGLVNAMCLDGGGSVALSFEGKSIAAGRNVNNALAFVSDGASSAPAPAPVPALVAKPTASSVLVNGESKSFDAYNIEGNNYFKLRDLAFVLNGSEKRFEVGWDGATGVIALTSGTAYTEAGGEMQGKSAGDKTPTVTNSEIVLDGRTLALTAYHIEGNNYFKLRDIGEVLDFDVTWDGARNTIVIDTSKPYTAD
jgi:exopolysaccharide biosynthesis protein